MVRQPPPVLLVAACVFWLQLWSSVEGAREEADEDSGGSSGGTRGANGGWVSPEGQQPDTTVRYFISQSGSTDASDCSEHSRCALALALRLMDESAAAKHILDFEAGSYSLKTELNVKSSLELRGPRGATLSCEGRGLRMEAKDAKLAIRGLALSECHPAIFVQGSGNMLEIEETFITAAHCEYACIDVGRTAKGTRLHLSNTHINVTLEGRDSHGLVVGAPDCVIVVNNSSIASKAGSGIRLTQPNTSLRVDQSTLAYNDKHGIDIPSGGAAIDIINSSCSYNKGGGLMVEEASVSASAVDSSFVENQDTGLLVIQTQVSLSANISLERVSLKSNGINGIYIQGLEENRACSSHSLHVRDASINSHASYGVLLASPCAKWRSNATRMVDNSGGIRIRGHKVDVDITAFVAEMNRGPGLEVLSSTSGSTSTSENNSTVVVAGVTARWNTDGLRFDAAIVNLTDVRVDNSLHGIRIESSQTKAHLRNITLNGNGDGLALLKGPEVEIVDIVVERNFHGVVAYENSSCILTNLTAQKNHLAIASQEEATLHVNHATITDNLKGIKFVSRPRLTLSPDSFVYLNRMNDIQCEEVSEDAGWLQDWRSWLSTGWQPCTEGFYTWSTWILAVPYQRAENFTRLLTCCFCAALNIPLLLANRKQDDDEDGGLQQQQQALGHAHVALRLDVAHMRWFMGAAMAVTLMLANCMYYIIAFKQYGTALVDDEVRYTSSRNEFLVNQLRWIGTGLLASFALFSALLSLRKRPITRKEAWSTLAKDVPERQQMLRQQLVQLAQ